MKHTFTRRKFILSAASAAVAGTAAGMGLDFTKRRTLANTRVGIIGLDTSHSVAFTKTLNDPAAGAEFGGYKVVSAYPKGSNDIKSSVERIPGYIDDVKKLGVEIAGSIEELLTKVDVVLLETNDGRLHLEQALPVLKAGKKLFIDKPIAASLPDAIAIFDASKKYNVPVFSSSSLRFIKGAQDVAQGKTVKKVMGADTYSPCKLENTHPDLFWYGIHGVELLFTVMGTGCKSVVRIHTDDTDMVLGAWEDKRVGSFRGMRSGKSDYGGTVFGDNGIVQLGSYDGYNPLLVKIIEFFNSGKPPVSPQETLEIYAFMEAADESKRRGGIPISIAEVFAKAKKAR